MSATKAAPMKLARNGTYTCSDHPTFTPNQSPEEMFQAGIFGGTYFRDIKIGTKWYRNAWKEFEPHGWFAGLHIPAQVSSSTYVVTRNRYKARCGQSLEQWLEKGWIMPDIDSHGWVHWYCRFFLGRRCSDDERQIARWRACAGERGRWKRNLIAKCVKAGKAFDDESVSPTVRQLLLHWAYELTRRDFDEYKKMIERGHRTSFVPQSEMKHVVKGKQKDDGNETESAKEEKRETKRKIENDARTQRRNNRSRNA